MILNNLIIDFSQENNMVFLHIEKISDQVKGTFYFEAPNGFKINDVDEDTKELAIYLLLFNMGYFNKIGSYEMPKNIFENISKPIVGNKIGLCYSNGKDSTACLLCIPEEDTIPFYIYRDFSKTKNDVIDYLKKNNKHFKDDLIKKTQNYNHNALKFIDLAQIPKIQIIKTDFELIRPFFNIKDHISYGFSSGIGYASLIILLSNFFDIGYLALGAILESVFLGSGHRFIDVLDKNRKGESLLIRYKRIFRSYGFELFYPLGGCSEVISNKIVENSKYKTIACSCQGVVLLTNENYCKKCFKCFRNFGQKGELIPMNNSFEWLLYHFPLKMATSTLYACFKCNYTNIFLEQYNHLDLNFLERYYYPYLMDETENNINIVPEKYRSYILNKLKENEVYPMTEQDINNLKNIGEYFDNIAYDNLKISSYNDFKNLNN